MSESVLTILCVKTNKGCFISDCKATGGYDYDYHLVLFLVLDTLKDILKELRKGK